MKERYAFYFKIPNKDEPILYSFHTDVSIKFFINFIKDEMRYITPQNIEIFETLFCDLENKKKIDYNENLTLDQIFKDRVKETLFYIKIIDDNQNDK